MNDFVLEIVEQERPASAVNRTGWEGIVFQLEDEPESDFSTAVTAP